MVDAPTRGERNHNPGNLEYESIPWDGLADPPKDDKGYCVFVTAPKGLRALARDCHSKWWFDGLDTIAKIITKYAPPLKLVHLADGTVKQITENDTTAYIKDVSDRMGVAPDAPIDLADPGQLQVLAHAVILHENGRCIYPDSMIADAVQQALGRKIGAPSI